MTAEGRDEHLRPERPFVAGERFEYWREMACQVRLAPVEVRSDNQAGFRCALRYSDLGATRVSLFTASSYQVRRTPRLIRQSDPERLSVGMVLGGHATVSQSGRQARVPSSTFSLYDSSRPYGIDLGPAGGSDAVRGMDHYTPAEAARLSVAALDVLATRLAHELDADRWVPPETRRRVLLTHIHAFIQLHLGDPELSPAEIASAHHISLRLLHKLFQEQGETVAGWIRARRLAGCQRDLTDPAQANRPVAAIAARRGFRSAIHFSRVFRAAYGLPPHEYRLSQLGSPLVALPAHAEELGPQDEPRGQHQQQAKPDDAD